MSVLARIRGVVRSLKQRPRAQRRAAVRARRRLLLLELLEDRVVPAAFTEVEANNTAAEANDINVPTADVLFAGHDDWINITGAIGSGGDLDYFRFTLQARSGVFFDIDSRETGLSSTLNSLLFVFDEAGTTPLGSNDNGYDFDTGWPVPFSVASFLTADSSLYLDLDPGTYLVRVSSLGGTVGDYLLRLLADSNYSSTVPALDSNPSAAATLFLDFDGHAATDAWGTYRMAAYDLNGNGAEFSPAERLAIKNMWRTVAEDYSPFALNVSTSYDGPFTDRVAFRQVIANSNGSEIGLPAGTLGVAILGSWNSGGSFNNMAFTFALNGNNFAGAGISGLIVAKAFVQANTSAHEIGHAFGLRHYTGPGQQVALLFTPNPNVFGEGRRFFAGINDLGVAQDDMAIISNAMNGFGYRADDHGGTFDTATELGPPASNYAVTGIIERVDDRDYFRFTAAGLTSIAIDVDTYVNNLDTQLSLFGADGTLIASASPASSFGAFISQTLPAGTYYIEVKGTEEVGRAGQYVVRISTEAIPSGSPPVLETIAHQTIPAEQDVVVVTLSASDPDGDALTFSATAESLAYVLDQQRGFFSDGNLYEDWGGRGDRWVQGAGGVWYFILPNGELYLWDGSSEATGERIATVGTSYYLDPRSLYEAVSDPHAALRVEGSVLTIDREDGFIGSFVVTVTASDGRFSDSKTFTVTVSQLV